MLGAHVRSAHCKPSEKGPPLSLPAATQATRPGQLRQARNSMQAGTPCSKHAWPRACSKDPHRAPCFVKVITARRKARNTKHGTRNTEHGTRNTEQERAACPAQHWQHGRWCLCKASLRARQPMSMLFVAPLAKTGRYGRPGCGVRRYLGYLLRLRT